MKKLNLKKVHEDIEEDVKLIHEESLKGEKYTEQDCKKYLDLKERYVLLNKVEKEYLKYKKGDVK